MADLMELLATYRVEEFLAMRNGAWFYRARLCDDENGERVLLRVFSPSLAKQRGVSGSRPAIGSDIKHRGLMPMIDGGEYADPIKRKFLHYTVEKHYDPEYLLRIRELAPEDLRTPQTIAEIAADLSAALAYLENHGLQHGAILPGNVLLPPGGGARLMHPHVARLVTVPRERAEDEPRSVPADFCVAPEQGKDSDPTIASDIYGIGALLFYIATGKLPHADRNSQTVSGLRAPDPRSLRSDLGNKLTAIIVHALQEDPVRRYQSAREFANDCYQVAEGRSPKFALAALGQQLRRQTEHLVDPHAKTRRMNKAGTSKRTSNSRHPSGPAPAVSGRSGLPIWVWFSGGGLLVVLAVVVVLLLSGDDPTTPAVGDGDDRLAALVDDADPAADQPERPTERSAAPASDPTDTNATGTTSDNSAADDAATAAATEAADGQTAPDASVSATTGSAANTAETTAVADAGDAPPATAVMNTTETDAAAGASEADTNTDTTASQTDTAAEPADTDEAAGTTETEAAEVVEAPPPDPRQLAFEALGPAPTADGAVLLRLNAGSRSGTIGEHFWLGHQDLAKIGASLEAEPAALPRPLAGGKLTFAEDDPALPLAEILQTQLASRAETLRWRLPVADGWYALDLWLARGPEAKDGVEQRLSRLQPPPQATAASQPCNLPEAGQHSQQRLAPLPAIDGDLRFELSKTGGKEELQFSGWRLLRLRPSPAAEVDPQQPWDWRLARSPISAHEWDLPATSSGPALTQWWFARSSAAPTARHPRPIADSQPRAWQAAGDAAGWIDEAGTLSCTVPAGGELVQVLVLPRAGKYRLAELPSVLPPFSISVEDLQSGKLSPDESGSYALGRRAAGEPLRIVYRNAGEVALSLSPGGQLHRLPDPPPSRLTMVSDHDDLLLQSGRGRRRLTWKLDIVRPEEQEDHGLASVVLIDRDEHVLAEGKIRRPSDDDTKLIWDDIPDGIHHVRPLLTETNGATALGEEIRFVAGDQAVAGLFIGPKKMKEEDTGLLGKLNGLGLQMTYHPVDKVPVDALRDAWIVIFAGGIDEGKGGGIIGNVLGSGTPLITPYARHALQLGLIERDERNRGTTPKIKYIKWDRDAIRFEKDQEFTWVEPHRGSYELGRAGSRTIGFYHPRGLPDLDGRPTTAAFAYIGWLARGVKDEAIWTRMQQLVDQMIDRLR